MNFSQADTVAKNLNLEFQKTLILDVCSASILHFERNSQVIDCEAEAFTVKITLYSKSNETKQDELVCMCSNVYQNV
jgi:hypothetical protein